MKCSTELCMAQHLRCRAGRRSGIEQHPLNSDVRKAIKRCLSLLDARVDVVPSFCIRNYNGLALGGPA